MRYLPLFVLLVALTSCTVLRPEGTLVRGSVWLVPQADIRSAIAVARTSKDEPTEPITSIVVSSRSELYVYFFDDSFGIDDTIHWRCAVVRKEAGRWHYVGMAESYGL